MTETFKTSTNETILVFLGGMERSLRFARRSETALKRLIGASSVRFDPASDSYGDWAYLPDIMDPGFADALRDTVRQNQVGAIFTPHPVIGTYLESHLAEVAPGVRLIHDSLLDSLDGYRRHAARGFGARPDRSARPVPVGCGRSRPVRDRENLGAGGACPPLPARRLGRDRLALGQVGGRPRVARTALQSGAAALHRSLVGRGPSPVRQGRPGQRVGRPDGFRPCLPNFQDQSRDGRGRGREFPPRTLGRSGRRLQARA